MSQLEEMAKTFIPSKAVFKVKVADDGRSVGFDVKEPKSHACDPSDDPVRFLMCQHLSEVVDVQQRRFDINVNYNSIMSAIIRVAQEFVVKTSPLKNPRQTKLYKWLYDLDCDFRNEYADGLISLYRYMVKQGIHDPVKNNLSFRSDDPHVKNVVAILELMRAKYERN